MATSTCTRALPPPPPPPPVPAAMMITDPGKEMASWLPETEKPVPYLPPAIAPADLAKPGKEMGSWLPEPEKEGKEKPLARPAMATADIASSGKEMSSWVLPEPEKEKPLARPAPAIAPAEVAIPGKKMRRPVPVTDEERDKIRYLKDLHQTVLKELLELTEVRKELRRSYDDILFRRRCLAARLVSRVVFHRRDEAYVRHELDIGLKLGDKLPEELKKARKPITNALVMWADMGRAVQIGMDEFIAEYSNPQEYFMRLRKEIAPKDYCEEKAEAPLNSVVQK